MMPSSYDALFDRLGYCFSSPERLEEALTHASATRHKNVKDNERLEFLGDRVVGLVLADLLLTQYPHSDEGELAKRHAALVSRDALLKIAKKLDLETYLKRSSSFETYEARCKKSSLADACEALIAALYLEAGFSEAKRVLQTLWAPLLAEVREIPEEPKSSLQEWAQSQKLGLPVYTLKSKTGPEHAPLFKVEVLVGTSLKAAGSAASKRQAERAAAEALLRQLREKTTKGGASSK